MGWKCCVPECRSGYSDKKEYVGEIKISFYRFPADPDLKSVWIRNIERPDWEPTPNSRVCSLHFKETDFQDGRKDKRLKWRKDPTSKLKVKLLLPDAVPILFSSDEIKSEMNRKILALQNKSEPIANDFANGGDCQETLENDPLNDLSPMEAEDLHLINFQILFSDCYKMGWKCCVPECRSGYKDTKENPSNENKYVGEIKLSFHTFPADPDLKNVWIKNIERPDWEPTPNSRVCSLHFKESDFQDGRKDKGLKWRKYDTSKLKMKLLLPDAAPSLFSSNDIEIEINKKILALQNKSEPIANDFANGDDCQETLENDPLNDSSPMEAEDLPLSTFKIKVEFLVFYNTLSFSTLAKLRKN